MKLAPRYCRTCGSRILVRNICHDCGSNPLEGNNYCYDCGALTPKETSCTNCGATFKRKTSAASVVIASVLIIAVAIGCVLLYQTSENQKPQSTANLLPTPAPSENKNTIEEKIDTIKNNPDTIKANNNLPAKIVADTIVNKNIITVDTPKAKVIAQDTSSIKKAVVEGFSGDELKAHNIKCSYFDKKRQKNSVLFFTENALGYIKIGAKILELKRTHKNSDQASYSGDNFEVIITIDGLSGSDKDWLAACTLSVKDVAQKTSAKYKIYSHCIDL